MSSNYQTVLVFFNEIRYSANVDEGDLEDWALISSERASSL